MTRRLAPVTGRGLVGVVVVFATLVAPLDASAQASGDGGDDREQREGAAAEPGREGREAREKGDEEQGSEGDDERAEGGQKKREEQGDDEETSPASSMDESELFEVGEERDEEEGESRDGGPSRRRGGEPLHRLSKDEAEQAGFKFGEEETEVEQTAGILAAATSGLVVHGIGHWYLERPRAARLLAGIEGASVLLAGSGLAVWALEGDTAAGSAYAGAAFPLGAGLFGASYAIDLVGTLNGNDRAIPANRRTLRRIDVIAGYRYTTGDAVVARHALDTAVEFDVDRFTARGSTLVGLRLDTRRHGGSVGWRLLRGASRLTHLGVEARGHYLRFDGVGRFQRWSGDVRLGGFLDLGAIAPSLSEIALGGAVGMGHQWTWLPAGPRRSLALATRGFYVPVEVVTHFNVVDRLHAELAYRRVPDRLLQRTRRLAGVGELELTYSSSPVLDFFTTVEVGGGVSVGAGVSFRLWR